MGNSLLAVRVINHKYIVVALQKEIDEIEAKLTVVRSSMPV